MSAFMSSRFLSESGNGVCSSCVPFFSSSKWLRNGKKFEQHLKIKSAPIYLIIWYKKKRMFVNLIFTLLIVFFFFHNVLLSFFTQSFIWVHLLGFCGCHDEEFLLKLCKRCRSYSSVLMLPEIFFFFWFIFPSISGPHL